MMEDELRLTQRLMQGSGLDLNLKLTKVYACYENGEYVGVWPEGETVGNSRRLIGRRWYLWTSREGRPFGVDAYDRDIEVAFGKFRDRFRASEVCHG